jgi:hypothetical protein
MLSSKTVDDVVILEVPNAIESDVVQAETQKHLQSGQT